LLELFSKEINNSKRVEECIILKILLESNTISVVDFKNIIKQKYGYEVSQETIDSSISNLNFKFIREKKEGKLI
jgi:hypothetical protein